MTRYIGLDVHAQTTAIGIVSESGRRLAHSIVPTRATELISELEKVPRPRRLVLEEGAQSEWLSQVLERFVDELVVTVPRRNPDQTKNDLEDAFARAEDLRRNALDTRVFKARVEHGALRAAMKLYESLTRDVVRSKNQFRGLLLSRGITERTPYDPSLEELEALLTRLPQALRFSAEARLEKISNLESLRERAQDALLEEARNRKAFPWLTSVPGIGEVRAATLLAVVIDPNRFRRSHHFCSYCGLGVRTTASGEWAPTQYGRMSRVRAPLPQGLRHGNSLLKTVFCGAALTVSRMTDHPLAEHHRALLRRGLKETLARITVARKLAAITLAIWKNEEVYDPKKHHHLK